MQVWCYSSSTVVTETKTVFKMLNCSSIGCRFHVRKDLNNRKMVKVTE